MRAAHLLATYRLPSSWDKSIEELKHHPLSYLTYHLAKSREWVRDLKRNGDRATLEVA